MTTPSASAPDEVVLSTGVAGLDEVLGGGLTPSRLYLVEGEPGSGKTTVAMRFLLEGAARGEPVLYITLSETQQELQGVAQSHGWDLAGVKVHDMQPDDSALEPDEQYTMFHPSELELSQTTIKILSDVQRLQPTRVVFDSLSELRLLAGTSLRYRRQILALKQFFAGRQCTVLLLDDLTALDHDQQVQSIAHGVLRLEARNSDYGATRRRLLVVKYRGRAFRDGWHDYKIERGGLRVFPRLVAAEHKPPFKKQKLLSGSAPLDQLLGGGLEPGTSTLLLGAPGTGKSSLAVHFSLAAVERGDAAVVFLFDESVATLRGRCEGMGLRVGDAQATGRLHLRQVDPAEMSPGEFAQEIRDAVTRHKATVVVIDSLNGYLNAMPDERFLIAQLHELLSYLGHSGVVTLLVGAQHGLIGTQMQSPVDASYLADGVLLLRYYELEGEVRQAVSIVKKRGGSHERSIRAFSMSDRGIVIGEPLRRYRGVLTGVPVPLPPEPNVR